MSTTGQRFINNKNNNRPNMRKNNFNNNKPGGQGQRIMNGNKGNREAVIRRNLEHMKQVAEKKRLAQEWYYQKHNRNTGRSPMIKPSSGPFIKQENIRGSVQQRLGNRGKPNNTNRKQIFTNRKPIFTNKKPIFINTKPTQQFGGGMRSDKIVRVQNVQQKKSRFRNSNTVKTINSAGKVVYLQAVNSRRPTNYTVKVENDRKHHVQNGLNPVLQQEIKMIQNKSARQMISPVVAPTLPPRNPYLNVKIDRLPIVSTGKTLHERFSLI